MPFSFPILWDLAFCSRIFLQSSTSYSLVITTSLGRMPTRTCVPSAFSHCTHSSRWYISSYKAGPLSQFADLCSGLIQPALHHSFGWAWMEHCTSVSALWKERKDTIFLWMWEGAWKCLLQFLLQSEATKGLNFIFTTGVSAMAAKGKSYLLIFRMICIIVTDL